MCGIAGIIDLGRRAIDPKVLKSMTDTIRHRGPDDEGYALIDQTTSYFQTYIGTDSPVALKEFQLPFEPSEIIFPANLGLSHRRFSIIDLTPTGHQPFFDKERSCCVVFNGEIYNYIELRKELESRGAVFQSYSDTEVLLEAYKAWGSDCFQRFIGFWALALYDFRKKQLILSRDHMGKRPLYWSRVKERIYFASEIKALLQIAEITNHKRVNSDAIWHWCTAGMRDLDFSTCFENIFTLPSASWTIVDENFPHKINIFWKVPEKRLTETDIGIPEAARHVRETLKDAISIRLRSDVPLAFELSGGMDSSLVVALAAQSYPGQITTYTVRFSDPRWDEEPFARSVAERYHVDYRIIDSPVDTMWHDILSFVYLQEEPFHSPNIQINQSIWSIMRTYGTKVVLNGVGGDELFAGYSWYFPKLQNENLKMGNYYQFIENALCELIWKNTITTSARSLMSKAIHSLKYLTRGSSTTKGEDNFYLRGIARPKRQFHTKILSELLYMDVTNTLIPYWLRLSDKISMGVPIECRSPFLDYRVAELAMRLPVTYLIRHGWRKWILRKAFEKDLPSDVIWRRQKMGFPFPYEKFYKNSNGIINHIFSQANNPYINFSHTAALQTKWRVISFILWYELFFNRNFALFDTIEDIFKPTKETSGTTKYYTPAFLGPHYEWLSDRRGYTKPMVS